VVSRRSATAIRDSSPSVMPWRMARANRPTVEKYGGSITLPWTKPPIGLGRSSTITGRPRREAACMTPTVVAR
jgi:hypothetical protein